MYDYQIEKPRLFTDEGQRSFLKTRDHVKAMLKLAGAIRMDEATKKSSAGDSWGALAEVDRLVELGEIREVERAGVAGQDRIFVSNSL